MRDPIREGNPAEPKAPLPARSFLSPPICQSGTAYAVQSIDAQKKPPVAGRYNSYVIVWNRMLFCVTVLVLIFACNRRLPVAFLHSGFFVVWLAILRHGNSLAFVRLPALVVLQRSQCRSHIIPAELRTAVSENIPRRSNFDRVNRTGTDGHGSWLVSSVRMRIAHGTVSAQRMKYFMRVACSIHDDRTGFLFSMLGVSLDERYWAGFVLGKMHFVVAFRTVRFTWVGAAHSCFGHMNHLAVSICETVPRHSGKF